MSGVLFHRFIVLFFTGAFLSCSAYGQKILVLENSRSLRNIKYYQGKYITLILNKDEVKVTDILFDMTDSSLVLSNYGDIPFHAIKAVVRDNHWIRIISGFSMIAGAAYFAIDSFNRLINAEWPMVDEQTLTISAVIVGFGFALLPLRYHRIPVGDKWKLKVLDPSAF